MPKNDLKYKAVLIEFPAHLENPPTTMTKRKIFDDAKILYKRVKELEQQVEFLKREKQMLEDINDKLGRNLRIFAPGKTVGDFDG